jgi:hypothetical protein
MEKRGIGGVIPVSNDDALDGLHGRNFGGSVGGSTQRKRRTGGEGSVCQSRYGRCWQSLSCGRGEGIKLVLCPDAPDGVRERQRVLVTCGGGGGGRVRVSACGRKRADLHRGTQGSTRILSHTSINRDTDLLAQNRKFNSRSQSI